MQVVRPFRGLNARPAEPEVTVFCPIYNDEKYIDDFVPSVLGQTYTNFRFTILENGSSDETRTRLQRFDDPRIQLIKAHINFRSETGARAVMQTNTKYLAIIFADDQYLPKHLEISIETLERTGADACFSNSLFMTDSKQLIVSKDVPITQFKGDVSELNVYEHLWHLAMRGNTLHPVSMVIRMDAYRDLGGFRGDMHQIGDMDFMARLLMRKRVVFIKEPLQRIRIRSASAGGPATNQSDLSGNVIAKIQAERINFLNNYRSPEGLEIADRIFLPAPRGISIPESMRLWFVGHQFLVSSEPDYRFFGISCLYDALKQNGSEIEGLLTAALGVTPGAYMDRMGPKVFGNALDLEREVSHLRAVVRDLMSRVSGTGTEHAPSAPPDGSGQIDVGNSEALAFIRNALDHSRNRTLRHRIRRLGKTVGLHRDELRNAKLPGFDRNFYLRNNPDVADGRIDPLRHFLTHGWKEGRDPSSLFSVIGYLENNPDVKLSGVNPLLHYVEHGAREGRVGWKR